MFIVAFQIALFTFGFTKSISQCLPGSTLDVVEEYSHVQTVTEVLQTIRNTAEEEFHKLHSKSEAMAKIA